MIRSVRHIVPMLAALAVASTAPAAAQSAQFGVMAGASLSTFTGDVVEDLDNYGTFLVGGFVRLGISGATVEPGVVFTRKGAKFEESGAEVSNALDYIQVPLVLKIGMPVGSSARFYIGAGPAIGIKVGCAIKGSALGLSASTDCEDLEGESEGLRAKSTEFSGIGVAGIEFGKFAIGLRADVGLTNAYEAFFENVNIEPDLKTRTISAVASVRF